jgi:hypothetical protein
MALPAAHHILKTIIILSLLQLWATPKEEKVRNKKVMLMEMYKDMVIK